MKKYLYGFGALLLVSSAFADDSGLDQSIKQMLTAAKNKQLTSELKVAKATQGTGPLLLRDAIYLYNLPIRVGYVQLLSGLGCDIFQLVLDLESGYSDIWISEGIYEGLSLDGSGGYVRAYPDRIFDHAAMFAYALYTGFNQKDFQLTDTKLHGQPGVDPTPIVGWATAFAYCFSTDPAALIKYYDEINDRWYFSNEINPG